MIIMFSNRVLKGNLADFVEFYLTCLQFSVFEEHFNYIGKKKAEKVFLSDLTERLAIM